MTDIAVLQHQDYQGVSRLKNIPQATTDGEPVTLGQMNAFSEGRAFKDDVRVASVANINLTSPGATIDGITMVVNDRFLAKDQTDPSQNGTYVWNGAAVAATRDAEMSASAEFNGAVVPVLIGTANAGTYWRQTTANPTVGTSAISFTPFNSGAPSASETTQGISERATQAEVNAGTDDERHITALKLKNSVYVAKRFSQVVGDGSATSITVTHNLGTIDVQVVVRRISDGAEVIVDNAATSVNAVTLTTSAALANAAYRVTIIG